MLSVNVVDGMSSRIFEALSVEVVRTDLADSSGRKETLSLCVKTQGWHDGVEFQDFNFDKGTAYVMNSSGSTIGTYVLGEQGMFSPKPRKDVAQAA